MKITEDNKSGFKKGKMHGHQTITVPIEHMGVTWTDEPNDVDDVEIDASYSWFESIRKKVMKVLKPKGYAVILEEDNSINYVRVEQASSWSEASKLIDELNDVWNHEMDIYEESCHNLLVYYMSSKDMVTRIFI